MLGNDTDHRLTMRQEVSLCASVLLYKPRTGIETIAEMVQLVPVSRQVKGSVHPNALSALRHGFSPVSRNKHAHATCGHAFMFSGM